MINALIDVVLKIPNLIFGLIFAFIGGLLGATALHLIFGGNFWLWFVIFGIIGFFYKPQKLSKQETKDT